MIAPDDAPTGRLTADQKIFALNLLGVTTAVLIVVSVATLPTASAGLAVGSCACVLMLVVAYAADVYDRSPKDESAPPVLATKTLGA
jgi:hypothetical protein